MGRNESTVELLVKVWEGIREFLEVPNESTGSFFRHMRVLSSPYISEILLANNCVALPKTLMLFSLGTKVVSI